MSLLAVLVFLLLFTTTAAVASQMLLQTKWNSHLRTMLAERDLRITQLTNLVVSKDPMTYATLQSQSTLISTSDAYVETGTDEAEAARWRELMNQPPVDDSEYRADLEEMGLR